MDQITMNILAILVNSQDYITYNYISKKLNISIRTVARYIKNIDSYFKSNGIIADKKRGIGIKLILSDIERKGLKELLVEKEVDFLSKLDRKLIIICELLTVSEPIKSFYFSSILKVSLGTISRDLEEVEKWSEENGLKLIKNRGNGLYIEGDEGAIREAIVNLILSNLDYKKVQYWSNDIVGTELLKDYLSPLTKIKFSKIIDSGIVRNVIKIVDSYDENLKEILVDSSYFSFILFISLTVNREDHSSDLKEYNLDKIKELAEYNYILKLISEIKKIYPINISDNDVYIITVHLITGRTRGISKTKKDIMSDMDLLIITKKIISNIKEELNEKIDNDDELLIRLMVHLELMIKRTRMGISVSNNLLESIKTDYKDLYSIVKKSVSFLSRIIGKEISDEEIGYITVHIGATLVSMENKSQNVKAVVVCISGIGTSKILVEKIKQKIENIEIISTISSNVINEYGLSQNGVDLIISSVNIDTQDIPNVVVNPLLMKEDVFKINKIVNEIKSKKNAYSIKQKVKEFKKEKYTSSGSTIEDIQFNLRIVQQLIENFYFEGGIQLNNKNELIKYVSKQISNSSEMEQQVSNKLFKREEFGTTVIDGKGLILLHCKFKDTIKLGIVRLNESIDVSVGDYSEKTNVALVMIIPEEPDERVVEIFSEISKAVVLGEGFINTVCKESKTAILQMISKMLVNYVWRKTK